MAITTSADGKAHDGQLNALGRQRHAIAATVSDISSIVTHDLCNPLQSLTVFLELALEASESPSLDSRPSSQNRLRQCLEATHTMRRILRDYGQTSRRMSADENCDQLLTGVLNFLEQRFRKHGSQISRSTRALESIEVGHPHARFGLLSVFIGILNGLESSAPPESHLHLEAHVPVPPDHPTSLAVEIQGADIPLKHRLRCIECFSGSNWQVSEHTCSRVVIQIFDSLDKPGTF